MSFIDNYDFEHLSNESEKMVLEELGRQLETRKNICLCNDCVLDMAAMALNNVRPLYRVSLLGTIYVSRAMDEPGYAKEIKDSVSKAIEKVGKNPSHEK